MKTHTTNYYNTLIEIANDTKALQSIIPPTKANKTVANFQYEILSKHPYQYTSDDLLFDIYAERNDITANEKDAARTAYFSKGQACLRTSPLAKTYGFGIHFNEEGKIALVGMKTDKYQDLLADNTVMKLKAIKSSR